MQQDRTWNLIALKLTGKASPEEWAELELLMERRPEIVLHLQALTNFWQQHSVYDRGRIEKALAKIASTYAGENDSVKTQAFVEGPGAGASGIHNGSSPFLGMMIGRVKKWLVKVLQFERRKQGANVGGADNRLCRSMNNSVD